MDYGNLTVRQEKKEYPKPTKGLHDAICCGVWNVGTQKVEYEGDVKFKDQVVFGFELAETNPDTGVRFLQLKKYNVALYGALAVLKNDIESWRSEELTKEEQSEFDLGVFIGERCTLNLILNGDWVNIKSVSPPSNSNIMAISDAHKSLVPNLVKNLREKAIEPSTAETPKKEALEEVLPEVFSI